MLAIAQDGVEHDVGHFRVAAGGGLLSKSQSMGGPIRDEAGGGIGNNALKASSFAQHVCCFVTFLQFAKLKKKCKLCDIFYGLCGASQVFAAAGNTMPVRDWILAFSLDLD